MCIMSPASNEDAGEMQMRVSGGVAACPMIAVSSASIAGPVQVEEKAYFSGRAGSNCRRAASDLKPSAAMTSACWTKSSARRRKAQPGDRFLATGYAAVAAAHE
jgi:hypothetical protein